MEYTGDIGSKLYDYLRQHEFKYSNAYMVKFREQNGNGKLYGIRLFRSKSCIEHNDGKFITYGNVYFIARFKHLCKFECNVYHSKRTE